MAGIAGIILKKIDHNYEDYSAAIVRMQKKLIVDESQKQYSCILPRALFCQANPISNQVSDHFQYNKDYNTYHIIDGLIFIDEKERRLLCGHYHLSDNCSDYELLPYLYFFYKEDIVNHLTGWYNIFILEVESGNAVLFNDRLGYLPLYYYESKSIYMFSSKIESILASGLLSEIEFDATTIAEHLHFNYSISDNTYIKQVFTLPNAVKVVFTDIKSITQNYWNMGELYDLEKVSPKDSILNFNEGLSRALNKVFLLPTDKFNFSLTGGWDSRLVLSYLIPKYKDKLCLYSFGSKESDDITIPLSIAKDFQLNYTPYLLDKHYLDSDFVDSAEKTITLSGGTRNYRRAHYLWTIQQLSSISGYQICGIFGDEVMKVSHVTGGTVISQNLINILKSDFSLYQTVKEFKNNSVLDFINVDRRLLEEEFSARLDFFNNSMGKFDNLGQKYYSIRFELNLRKYFGNEVSSYNDYVYSFSPFIDYDFLKCYARTNYMDIQSLFYSNNIWQKRKSTHLYYNIVKKNCQEVASYNSSRGYSMNDVNSLGGNMKILYKKFLKKNKTIDVFNTGQTDMKFLNSLIGSPISNQYILSYDHSVAKKPNPDVNSLAFWMNRIEQKYK